MNTVHYTDHEAQSVLQDIAFVDTEHFSQPSTATSQQSHDPTWTLPLCPLAKLLETSPGRCGVHASYDISTSTYLLEYGDVCTSSHKCVSAYAGAGRVLGMVYRDWSSLERYIKHEGANPTLDRIGKIPEIHEVPKTSCVCRFYPIENEGRFFSSYFSFHDHYQQSLTAVTTSHVEFTWSHQTGCYPDAKAMLRDKTSPVGQTKGAEVHQQSDVPLLEHTPDYAKPDPSTSTGKLLHAVSCNCTCSGYIL